MKSDSESRVLLFEVLYQLCQSQGTMHLLFVSTHLLSLCRNIATTRQNVHKCQIVPF